MKIIEKAAALIIENRKLLMCRKKDEHFFITPGGKIEEGESIKQALAREVREELGVSVSSADFIGTFEAAHVSRADTIIKMHTYRVSIDSTPKAQAEIEALVWLDSDYQSEDIKVSTINEIHVIPELVSRDWID